MTRLCERPGCSAPAAVAYGMDSDQLLVWLAVVPDGGDSIRSGMLCRRHADAMVVPRGWTLDDRRESKPRLFRVADTPSSPSTANHPSRGRRPKPAPPAEVEPPMQLAFDAPPEPPEPIELIVSEPPPEMPVEEGLTVGDIRPLGDPDPDETKALPWRPIFDKDDDLGGLLQATSPLLSRAFRGRDASPPRST